MASEASLLEYYDVTGFSVEESCKDLLRLIAYVSEAELVAAAFLNGVTVSLEPSRGFSTDWTVDLGVLQTLLREELGIALVHQPTALFISSPAFAQVWSIPILSDSNKVIGALLASYKEPTQLNPQQREALITLSRKVQRELEIRRSAIQQEKVTIQTTKLSALGEMAAGIAHEINNPLAIIQGNLNKIRTLIEKNRFDVTLIQESVSTATRTVGRIGKIISGLRTFARDEVGEPFQSAELRNLVYETLSFCEERFKNLNVQMKVQVDPMSVLIECRPVQISQVLLNLLINAFDAITATNSHEKWISITCGEEKDFVTIRVTDSGPGITEVVRKRIFEPFFTTKSPGKGTGLGLSIAKGIVESHHGQLLLDTKNEHTSFLIRLPKSQATPSENSESVGKI